MNPDRDADLESLGEKLDLLVRDSDTTVGPIEVFGISLPTLAFPVEPKIASECSITGRSQTCLVCMDDLVVLGGG